MIAVILASSLFIVNAEKPMFIRSSMLITKSAMMNGIMRVRTLRVALTATVSEGAAGLVTMNARRLALLNFEVRLEADGPV